MIKNCGPSRWIHRFAILVSAFTSVPSLAQPVVFWASDPVGPRDTMIFVGDSLAGVSASLSRVPDGLSSEAMEAPVRQLPLIQAGPDSFKATIPQDFGDGIYRYRLTTPQGVASGFINQAKIYWFQGDGGRDARPGGWIRVMGRNVVRGPNAILRLRDASAGADYSLPASEGGLWDASFVVPNTMRPGSYRLELWNGQGSQETIVEIGRIEIRPTDFTSTNSIDVTKRGARGDGTTDDTGAFRQALQELGVAGGGQLWVPRGKFLLSDTLLIPENVTIAGAGAGLSVLSLRDSRSPPAVLLSGKRRFQIRDLAIEATQHNHLIEGGYAADGAGLLDADIRIERLRIRANMFRGQISPKEARQRLEASARRLPPRGPEALRLAGGNVVVVDNDIQGSIGAFILKDARDAYIAGNRFLNGRTGWYVIVNSTRVIFEKNVVVGADFGGGGGGIGTHWGPERAISQNILVKGNEFHDLAGGDGEAMTTDGPGGCFTGRIVATAGSRIVTLPQISPAEAGALAACRGAGGLAVISGRGAGEHAVVEHITGNTIELTQPMRVSSDTATTAVIVPVFQHILAVGNKATDAGFAIQFYGSSWDNVAADNVSVRTLGINVQGRPYGGSGRPTPQAQPAFFTQFLGNSLQYGTTDRRPPHQMLDSLLEARGIPVAGISGPIVRGVIMRGNRLEGNASIRLRGDDRGLVEPGLKDAVVEHNKIRDVDTGIQIFAGTTGVWIGTNEMTGVRRPQSGNARP